MRARRCAATEPKYLLARASTQPRGSENPSACQSQRTVFIMRCRDLISSSDLLAAACWPEDLIHDLRWIDAQASSPERLFTVATVKVGPHTGLRAVGIATNQKRLKSASNLALAFAGKLFQLFFVTLACTCFSFLHVGAPAKGCLEIVQNIRWLSARTTATHSAPLRGTTMW